MSSSYILSNVPEIFSNQLLELTNLKSEYNSLFHQFKQSTKLFDENETIHKDHVKALTMKIEQLSRKVHCVKDELKIYKAKDKAYTRDCRLLEEAADLVEKRENDIAMKYHDISMINQQLLQDNQQLNLDNMSLHKQLSELIHTNKDLKDINSVLEKSLSEAKATISLLRDRVCTDEQELIGSISKEREYEIHIKNLQLEVQQLEEDRDRKNDAIITYETSKSTLNLQMSQLRNTMRHDSEMKYILEKEVATLKKKIEVFEEDKKKRFLSEQIILDHGKKYDELDLLYKSLMKKYDITEKDAASLKRRKNTLVNDVKELSLKLTTADTALSESNKKVIDMHAKLSNAKARCATLEALKSKVIEKDLIIDNLSRKKCKNCVSLSKKLKRYKDEMQKELSNASFEIERFKLQSEFQLHQYQRESFEARSAVALVHSAVFNASSNGDYSANGITDLLPDNNRSTHGSSNRSSSSSNDHMKQSTANTPFKSMDWESMPISTISSARKATSSSSHSSCNSNIIRLPTPSHLTLSIDKKYDDDDSDDSIESSVDNSEDKDLEYSVSHNRK